MKKIYSLIATFSVAFSLQAQGQFFEDFESATIPDGWAVTFNGTGSFIPWVVTTIPIRVIEGNASAFADRQNTGPNIQAQQWLITPAIAVTQNSMLSFLNTRTFAGSMQGTTYAVKVSTTTQTDYANFSTLTLWNELQFDQQYTSQLSLAAYAGETVYIAFIRNDTQPANFIQGDRWSLDNVSVSSTLANREFTDAGHFSIFPNPASDVIHVKMDNVQSKSIAVYDLTGQLLLHYNDAANIDVSGLASGNYLIEVTSEKGKAVRKFIKL